MKKGFGMMMALGLGVSLLGVVVLVVGLALGGRPGSVQLRNGHFYLESWGSGNQDAVQVPEMDLTSSDAPVASEQQKLEAEDVRKLEVDLSLCQLEIRPGNEGQTGAQLFLYGDLKAEHIRVGYFDIYTKGGKVRRIYIPKQLSTEATKWLSEQSRSSGYVFLNQYGQRLTTRGIAQQLKNYARKYGMNEKVVYPHSFRHRFAKNFLDRFNDISLLADLMGHESIETTRIYLRRSSAEQQEIVDKVITW